MRIRQIIEGVGRITKQNQTQDVGPNEIPTQAKKFGNTVDKDGRPPSLSKKVKGKSTNVLFNLGLAEGQDSRVSEIEKDTTLQKDWVEKYDFDEFIGVAKPTKKVINGHRIYRIPHSELTGNEAETFLVGDPDEDEGFIGEFSLIKTNKGGEQFVHSQIGFAPEAQGKGLAVPLYAYAIKNLGYTIVSDKTQTKGSQKLWEKLSKFPGIFVYGWSVKDNRFFQWDPEVDPEDEVYYDHQELNKLRRERAEIQAQIDNLVRTGRMSEEEADELFQKKTAEIQQKAENIDKMRWSDLRLVATSTRGLGR